MSELLAAVTGRVKIRGFVLDHASGQPVAGVAVALWAEVDEGVERPVGVLTSDGAGYVSFDTRPLPSRPIAYLLKSGDFAPISVPSGAVADDRPSFIAYTSAREGRGRTLGVGSRGGVSVQNPDLFDLRISPASFGLPGSGAATGACQPPIPAQVATRDLRVLRTVIAPTDLPDGRWPSRPAGLSETGDVSLPAEVQLPLARLVWLRQQWWYIGSTLGDISYSLPLAPGETVQLATVDWSRSDRIVRTDQVDTLDRLNHELIRDRTLTDTVNAALTENQSGFSLMGGTGTSSSAGAALNLQEVVGFPLNIAAGASGIISAAGSVAVSNGERNVDADSTQTLNDVIAQSAWATRSLNSTVVVQADQDERNTLQSRAITNHNRCHALTMQYYEVLRTYRVETWRERTDRGVLIPYQPLAFDAQSALRHRTALQAGLLDPAWSAAFDALARVTVTPEIYDADDDPAPVPTGPVFAEGRYTFTVEAAAALDTGLTVQVRSTVSVVATGTVKFGTDVGAGYTADGSADSADAGYPAPGLRRLSLVCRVGNAWHQGGTQASFTANDEGTLVLQANDYELGNNSGSWSVTVVITKPVSTPAGGSTTPPWQSATATRLSRPRDEAAGKLLLRHLNDNSGYYSRLSWLLMHPATRRAALERYLSQRPDLAAVIGETPIAAYGQWLVFPSGPGDLEEPDADEYRRTQLISLPSRGLMAEAELGSCNACEQRDVTRNADWPLPVPAPIAPLRQGPTGQPATAPTPAALPAPIVAIQQAPAAPDPTGLAGALSLLAQPNVFRDMSGLQEVSALLDDLVNGTVSETNAAVRAAAAKQALQQAATGGGGAGAGNPAGGAPSRRAAPSTNRAGDQIDRLDAIDYARQRNQITEAQANDAAVGVVGGEVVLTGGAGGVGPAAAGKAIEVATDLVQSAVTNLLTAGNLTVEGPEAGSAAVIAGYATPEWYLDDTRVGLDVDFRELSRTGPLAGLDGNLRISWTPCYLDDGRVKAADSRRAGALINIRCIKDIEVDARQFILGQAVDAATIRVTLVQRRRNVRARYIDVTDPNPPIGGMVDVVARVAISITESAAAGGTSRLNTVPIPLDVADPNELVLWTILDDEENPNRFLAYRFTTVDTPNRP